jgi:hypothetical protein
MSKSTGRRKRAWEKVDSSKEKISSRRVTPESK